MHGLDDRQPPAPYGTHAERLDRLMLFVDSYCSPDDLLFVMATCIREQQAALAGVIRVADRATDEFDAARAVLAKYALEKP